MHNEETEVVVSKSATKFKGGYKVKLQVYCEIGMDAIEEAVSSYNETVEDCEAIKIDEWFLDSLYGEIDEDFLLDFVNDCWVDDFNLDPVDVVNHALERLY